MHAGISVYGASVMKYAESIIVIICCFFFFFLMPMHLEEGIMKVSNESLCKKQLTDIAYRLYTRRQIEIGDLGLAPVEVEIFEGDLYVSFPEICDVLERDGVYELKNATYVRITYGDHVKCLRLN